MRVEKTANHRSTCLICDEILRKHAVARARFRKSHVLSVYPCAYRINTCYNVLFPSPSFIAENLLFAIECKSQYLYVCFFRWLLINSCKVHLIFPPFKNESKTTFLDSGSNNCSVFEWSYYTNGYETGKKCFFDGKHLKSAYGADEVNDVSRFGSRRKGEASVSVSISRLSP